MGQQRRQKDYFSVFEETIDYALHTNADAILHTGNIFYSPSPTDEVVEQVETELERLAAYDVSFYLLYGKSDVRIQSVLAEFAAAGYLTRVTPKWNKIDDIAVFAYDATVDRYQAGHFFPPEDTVARVAVVFDEIERATRFESIKQFESEVGWSLDGVFIGNQEKPVDQLKDGVRILSPGSPERVIGKSDINSENRTPCQIYQYDIHDDGIDVTTRDTGARPVTGFRLELQPDDTLSDIQSTVEKLGVEGTAAIFEISGERSQTSPSKDDIEGLVSRYAAVALGYDERTGSTTQSVTEFTESKLDTLTTGDDETPDSTPVVQVFEQLRETLLTELDDTEWFQRYIWENNFTTPYIGPKNPETSSYIWLGLIDESYDTLPRASRALQLEFGVNGGSAPGFLGREVNWGIFLGHWANDDVVETVAHNLRDHSDTLVDFLAEHEEYVIVTKTQTLESPKRAEIETIIPEIENGFALTRDLEFTDLESTDPYEITYKTLEQLVPIYHLLADIGNEPTIRATTTEDGGAPTTTGEPPVDWDIESLASATELDYSQIESSIEFLIESGSSREKAINVVHRYLAEMLQGEGLFAIRGVGPYSGQALVEAGIETVEQLRSATPQQLAGQSDLTHSRLEKLHEAAQTTDLASLEADNEDLADQLLSSYAEKSDTSSETGTDQTTEKSNRTESNLPLNQWLDHHVLSPEELPMPDQDTSKTVDGSVVKPNYLTEYYEAFRRTRKVLQLVFQMGGIDIDPENRHDPRVQYFILLDACIGFTNLSVEFLGYGPQQQDRLPFSVDEYYTAYGDGETITDYQLVEVEPFTHETHELLQQKTNIDQSMQFVRPCVPGTDVPLPELPGSFEELQRALVMLDQFPAYPPLQTENGVNKRTIPIGDLYTTYFEALNEEYRVDLEPVARAKKHSSGSK